MAIITAVDYKAVYATDETDEKLSLLIARAQDEIERFCRRKFEAADYTEIYDGDGTPYLLLHHYPVITIYSIAVGKRECLYLTNTSEDAYFAYAAKSGTNLYLTVLGGPNSGELVIDLTGYDTIGDLIASVSESGWTAISAGTDTDKLSPTEILDSDSTNTCLNRQAAMYAPNIADVEFSCDTEKGILKCFETLPNGFQNIYVKYRAGYTELPADLTGICCDLVKSYIDNQTINQSMQSESLGDYSYSIKDNVPSAIYKRLEKFKHYL